MPHVWIPNWASDRWLRNGVPFMRYHCDNCDVAGIRFGRGPIQRTIPFKGEEYEECNDPKATLKEVQDL